MSGLAVRVELAAFSRPISTALDPLQLYAFLSGSGARHDTMLFERTGDVSLLLDQASLRIESRGRDVTAIAFSPNGEALLGRLKAQLAERLVQSLDNRALFRFPEIRHASSEARLRAPCPFDVLREVTTGLKPNASNEPFAALCIGVIAYDHVDFHEALPPAEADPIDFPDFLFWIPESLVVFERGTPPRAICTAIVSDDLEQDQSLPAARQRLSELVARCEAAPKLIPVSLAPVSAEFPPADMDMDDETFAALVGTMKAHILAGDVYQIVPSRTFSARCPDAYRAFEVLCAAEQTPYRFFLTDGAQQIFGASPEAAVRVHAGADNLVVETNPIAGTRARGSTIDEDNRIEAELRTDPKEVAEHLMLVDLARNDVARISVRGTRHVPSLMHVQRHSAVMHLASTVEGELRPDLDAFHAVQACLNVGTLTGAPKIRAMELLRQAELTKRGPYGGAIGWFNGDGAMDSAIAIRTALVRGETAHIRAGAGVVFDSDPSAEAEETKRKATALLTAIARAAA